MSSTTSNIQLGFRSQYGEELPMDYQKYLSPKTALLDLVFTPRFLKDEYLHRPTGMWRYREALPLGDQATPVSFGEGFTPLLPVTIHGVQVLIKQEQLFPSGSYKDRGAWMLISYAISLGITRVVEDSSGNAGAVFAAYCARADIQCHIYVPDDTSPGKLAQIRSYGAELVLVSGDRDSTAQVVLSAAEDPFYASHRYNPFFFHGTKTFAFEVWEQLGFQAPDTLSTACREWDLTIGSSIWI
jgi:threonine synthase